jgi:ascorbate-specific PTS system EIIC-type component UlaA
MEAFLVVGGFIFWLYIAIAAILFLTFVAGDNEIGGSIVVLAALVGLYFMFRVNVLRVFPHTFGGWLAVVLGYFVAGATWSVYKFFVTYRKEVGRIIKAHRAFHANATSEELSKAIDDKSPKASDMKAQILGWIVDWPVSVVIYVLKDILRDIANSIYNRLSGVYDRIALSVRESAKRGLDR